MKFWSLLSAFNVSAVAFVAAVMGAALGAAFSASCQKICDYPSINQTMQLALVKCSI
jgi:hypothetical protein